LDVAFEVDIVLAGFDEEPVAFFRVQIERCL
jgi:hypothetical protein